MGSLRQEQIGQGRGRKLERGERRLPNPAMNDKGRGGGKSYTGLANGRLNFLGHDCNVPELIEFEHDKVVLHVRYDGQTKPPVTLYPHLEYIHAASLHSTLAEVFGCQRELC